MRKKFWILGAVLPLVSFLAAPAMGQSSAPPAADRSDVESIDAIMTAVYDVISGAKGEARDWDRFKSLFTPDAKLTSVNRQAKPYRYSAATPDEFAERANTFFVENGFFEVETHRVTEQYGPIAHVFSTYDSRYTEADPEPFARGINSFQLMHDGERWWVVSIYWTGEGDDLPIPAKYLPGT